MGLADFNYQVASINDVCRDCTEDPTTEFVYQEDAPASLAYVSSEYPLESSDDEARYYFDDSAGEEVKVYIVDTGANLKHKVSDEH
jgi:hypothetical protein